MEPFLVSKANPKVSAIQSDRLPIMEMPGIPDRAVQSFAVSGLNAISESQVHDLVQFLPNLMFAI